MLGWLSANSLLVSASQAWLRSSESLSPKLFEKQLYRCVVKHDLLIFYVLIKMLFMQSKAQRAEPIDYEAVLTRNKVIFNNDPHRELLLFPPDDILASLVNNLCASQSENNVISRFTARENPSRVSTIRD